MDSLGSAEEERITRSEILGLVALGGRTGAFVALAAGAVVLVLLAGVVTFVFV